MSATWRRDAGLVALVAALLVLGVGWLRWQRAGSAPPARPAATEATFANASPWPAHPDAPAPGPRPHAAASAPPALSPLSDLVAPGPLVVPTGDYELALTEAELDAVVARRYAAVLSQPGLTPAQARRLRELLLERQQATIDIANASTIAGLNPVRDLAIIRQAIAVALQDNDDRLRTEFSSQLLAEVEATVRSPTGPAWPHALAQTLAAAGQPLSREQDAQLRRLLPDGGAAVAPDTFAAAVFGAGAGGAPGDARSLAVAAAVLSPQQLASLSPVATGGQ